MRNLFRNQPDYNPDKSKPYDGVLKENSDMKSYSVYSVYSETGVDYLRRLEDIDISFIDKYFNNIIYALQYNSEGGVQDYNRKYKTTGAFMDQGDGGEIVDESELVVESTREYSPYEIQEAKNKVPYLLRRLHDRSKEIGVSLVSLIIAFERARVNVARSNAIRKTYLTVQPRHLLENRIYQMDRFGNITNLFGSDANKNSRVFQKAKEWLYSNESTRCDANEIVRCYEVLGIDIKEEEPTIYDEAYLSKLTVIYVTSNADYISRKSGGFIQGVYNELLDMPLEMVEFKPKVEEVNPMEPYYNAMQIFNSSIYLDDSVKRRVELGDDSTRQMVELYTKTFVSMYNKRKGTHINLDRSVTVDGFYHTKDIEPMVFLVNDIVKNEYSDLYTFYNTAVLTYNGYLVCASDGVTALYLSVEDACLYLSDLDAYSPTGIYKWKVVMS